MKIQKGKFINKKTAIIIRALHKKGGAMTPHEISEETGLSYITVKKYLDKLERWQIVLESTKYSALVGYIVRVKKRRSTKTRGRTKRYRLNYELIFKNKDIFT